jgi:hypothetical protein
MTHSKLFKSILCTYMESVFSFKPSFFIVNEPSFFIVNEPSASSMFSFSSCPTQPLLSPITEQPAMPRRLVSSTQTVVMKAHCTRRMETESPHHLPTSLHGRRCKRPPTPQPSSNAYSIAPPAGLYPRHEASLEMRRCEMENGQRRQSLVMARGAEAFYSIAPTAEPHPRPAASPELRNCESENGRRQRSSVSVHDVEACWARRTRTSSSGR